MYDLTAFQRDLLYVVAGLDEPHGLAIKEELENYYENALVKHVVGESEDGSNDFFEGFLTGFAEDSSPKLERSEIRCQFVL